MKFHGVQRLHADGNSGEPIHERVNDLTFSKVLLRDFNASLFRLVVGHHNLRLGTSPLSRGEYRGAFVSARRE